MENYDEEELMMREPIAAYGKKVFTIEEYLEFENASPAKHEYYQGEIFAMAGATNDHCYIERNLIVSLVMGLKKSPCEPLGSNKRLHIPSNTLFTYPDISVYCQDGLPSTETGASFPKVLIEILSKSTRKYDRGKKFELYKDIPGFQEYVLVDSQKPAIDIYRKITGTAWELKQYTINDIWIEIKSLNLRISFKKIYESVKFNNQMGFPILNVAKGKIQRA